MKMFTFISLFFITVTLPLFTNEISSNSPIITFQDMDQVMELAKSKPTVLFFKANWCPPCIEASKIFNKDIEQLKDVYLVVVNYDYSKDLQAKYGVTYQHTFVQVSSNGDAITAWSGGATPELLKKVVRGGY